MSLLFDDDNDDDVALEGEQREATSRTEALWDLARKKEGAHFGTHTSSTQHCERNAGPANLIATEISELDQTLKASPLPAATSNAPRRDPLPLRAAAPPIVPPRPQGYGQQPQRAPPPSSKSLPKDISAYVMAEQRKMDNKSSLFDEDHDE